MSPSLCVGLEHTIIVEPDARYSPSNQDIQPGPDHSNTNTGRYNYHPHLNRVHGKRE